MDTSSAIPALVPINTSTVALVHKPRQYAGYAVGDTICDLRNSCVGVVQLNINTSNVIVDPTCCFTLQKHIGDGSFTNVWKSCNRYAVKIFKAEQEELFENELRVLHLIDSAFNKLIEECDTADQESLAKQRLAYERKLFPAVYVAGCNVTSRLQLRPYLITDMWNTDIYTFMRRYDCCLPLKLTKKIVWNTLLAIRCLHSFNITHCDVKTENLLMNYTLISEQPLEIRDDISICLIDYGSSCIDGRYQDRCGTKEYSPPEALLFSEYNMSMDIWCLMITCFELLTGSLLIDVNGETSIKYNPTTPPSQIDTDQPAEVDQPVEGDHLAEVDQPIEVDHLTEVDRRTDSTQSYTSSDEKSFDETDDVRDDYLHGYLKILHCILGRIPDHLLERVADVFDYNCLDPTDPLTPTTITQIIERNQYNVGDVSSFVDFMMMGLQYSTADRKTAQECLSHPFLFNGKQ